jgi:hypothetical protein
MARYVSADYLWNPWLRWYYAHGGEEIIGPLGPLEAVALNPQPLPPGEAKLGPRPEPWRIAVAQLVRAAQAKDLTTGLPEGQQRIGLEKSAGAAIETILDDWCGTPPKYPYPWPWPGPPPWVWEIAAGLAEVASTLQPGSLRDTIQQVATQALQRASREASAGTSAR